MNTLEKMNITDEEEIKLFNSYLKKADLAKTESPVTYKAYTYLKEHWYRIHGGKEPTKRIGKSGKWTDDSMLVADDGATVSPRKLVNNAKQLLIDSDNQFAHTRGIETQSLIFDEEAITKVACKVAETILSFDYGVILWKSNYNVQTVLTDTGLPTSTAWERKIELLKRVKSIISTFDLERHETLTVFGRVNDMIELFEKAS